jgi:predicted PurR-regulated permease PerM
VLPVLDLDQDRRVKAAGRFAFSACFQSEGTLLRTIRQIFSSEDIIQLAIRLALLAFLIYWAFVLVRPFVPILAWSVVLAVALYPIYGGLAKFLGGRPKLAAIIVTLVNLGIVIGPATWLGLSAIDGVRELAGQIATGNVAVPSPPSRIKDWPLVGPLLFNLWEHASTNLRAVLSELAPHLKPLAGIMLSLVGSAGLGTLKFVLAVVLAGFLFPYGPQLVAAGRGFLYRIVPEQSEHFLELAGATIRAVSQGVIGVAIIQSLLAGVGFKLAGVPGAGLLAFVVLLLAIVQIGAAIVLIPAIIWIWTAKDFPTALLLTLFLVVVGLIDNVLKPLVMGRGLTTPTLVIFIGVVGGTLAHGIVGLFIGPIILAVVWELASAWTRDQTVPEKTASNPSSLASAAFAGSSDVDLNQRSPGGVAFNKPDKEVRS